MKRVSVKKYPKGGQQRPLRGDCGQRVPGRRHAGQVIPGQGGAQTFTLANFIKCFLRFQDKELALKSWLLNVSVKKNVSR